MLTLFFFLNFQPFFSAEKTLLPLVTTTGTTSRHPKEKRENDNHFQLPFKPTGQTAAEDHVKNKEFRF